MALQDIPRALLDFLDKYDTYFVVGHKEPDGDCLGSQLALASFLRRRGKNTALLSAGPFDRREIRRHENLFAKSLTPEQKTAAAGVIILDCASLERIGDIAQEIAGREIAVIDHHSAGDTEFGDIRYIRADSPCVTLLVQKIIEAFAEEPTQEEAHLIFSGFATDTEFFRHLENDAPEVLSMLSRLAAKGVTPRQIYRETFGSYSPQSRIFIADALKTMESHYGGRFILVHELLEHSREFQREHRQTDAVYQLLLSTEGCEALAFIREEDTGKTAVSLRSVDCVNVGLISRQFNGGGHKNAAGFTTALACAQIKPLLLAAFKKVFDPAPEDASASLA
ncbi:MAG: bifunctional oligoribonuclease/PAP phosphatase NrnA [Spirochaetales bacterium]|jgi:phosphoesterase RecJ-like protein|nr:bifunctional oligoribonuclease/PAP phosphatase NrnA [Spirochaetales bacterium]